MAPRIDIVGGLALIVVAVASLIDASDLDLGSLSNFGPGMLPTILATTLLACGVGLLGIGVFHRGPLVEQFRAEWRGPAMIGLAILVFALTIESTELGGIVVVPQLGLALAGPLTVILTGYGAAEADLRALAAIGCGLTAACLAMFNDVLTMDIPLLPRAAQNFLTDRIGAEVTLRLVYLLLFVIALAIVVTRRRRVAP
jgi:hypothetical protein